MKEILRFGLVKGRGISTEAVAKYLPANYTVVGQYQEYDDDGGICVIIAGNDDAGWTLDDYVIPRLASGLFFCWELEVK